MRPLALELKKLKIIKKGRFELKSGEVSDFYVDMKKAFGSPRAFRLICDELCRVIDKRATCVASSGHGGLPLATAVAIKLGLPLVLVRDKQKDHGVRKSIDGYSPTKKDKVVIIDDVLTSGTCISNICTALSSTKSEILAGYVVVSRGNPSSLRIPVENLIGVNELF